MMAEVAGSTLNSSAANLRTAVKGVASGTLSLGKRRNAKGDQTQGTIDVLLVGWMGETVANCQPSHVFADPMAIKVTSWNEREREQTSQCTWK